MTNQDNSNDQLWPGAVTAELLKELSDRREASGLTFKQLADAVEALAAARRIPGISRGPSTLNNYFRGTGVFDPRCLELVVEVLDGPADWRERYILPGRQTLGKSPMNPVVQSDCAASQQVASGDSHENEQPSRSGAEEEDVDHLALQMPQVPTAEPIPPVPSNGPIVPKPKRPWLRLAVGVVAVSSVVVLGLYVNDQSSDAPEAASQGPANPSATPATSAPSPTGSEQLGECGRKPSRASCDGKYSMPEGCQSDAVAVPGSLKTEAVGGVTFTVQLMWSPRCRTSWSMAHPDQPVYFSAYIEPDRHNAQRYFSPQELQADWLTSPMAYSDGGQTGAKACALLGGDVARWACTEMLMPDGRPPA